MNVLYGWKEYCSIILPLFISMFIIDGTHLFFSGFSIHSRKFNWKKGQWNFKNNVSGGGSLK